MDAVESAKYSVSTEGTAYILEEMLKLTLLPEIDDE
jgi:hypothetical protein